MRALNLLYASAVWLLAPSSALSQDFFEITVHYVAHHTGYPSEGCNSLDPHLEASGSIRLSLDPSGSGRGQAVVKVERFPNCAKLRGRGEGTWEVRALREGDYLGIWADPQQLAIHPVGPGVLLGESVFSTREFLLDAPSPGWSGSLEEKLRGMSGMCGLIVLRRTGREWDFSCRTLFAIEMQATTRRREEPATMTVSYRLPASWPAPSYDDLTFASCAEAKTYMDAEGEGRAEIGWGQLVVSDAPISGTTRPDGTIRAEVVVNYRIVPPVLSVILPRLYWPSMTPAERDALQDFYDALVNHEEGHIELAQAFAAANSGRTVSAEGRTREEAIARLRARVDAERAAAGKSLLELDEDYDKITDQGRRQSAVEGWTSWIGYPRLGVGPNLRFDCP